MFSIFAALAEFERELIRERRLAGLKAARVRGRKGGKKFALSKAQARLAQAALAQRDTSVVVHAVRPTCKTNRRDKAASETTYGYLRRSNRDAAIEISGWMNEWFSELPSDVKPKLERRLKASKDLTFNGARFELIVHRMLKRLGVAVDIERAIPNTNQKVDFFVSSRLATSAAQSMWRQPSAVTRRAPCRPTGMNSTQSENFERTSMSAEVCTRTFGWRRRERFTGRWARTMSSAHSENY